MSLPDFNEVDRVTMSCLPRSLLLHCFKDDRSVPHVFLFIGSSNGSVVTHAFLGGKLGEAKAMSLGGAPISLHKCKLDGQSLILAAGMRSALFFWTRDALQYSSVLVKVCWILGAII